MTKTIREEQIKAFRNMSIKDLRSWLLHLYVSDRYDFNKLMEIIIYVIAEKRREKGETNIAEERWLNMRKEDNVNEKSRIEKNSGRSKEKKK